MKKSGRLGETAYQIYQNQEASSLISCNVSSAPSTDKMSQKEKLNPLQRPRFVLPAQGKRVNLDPRGYNSTVGTSSSLLPLIRFWSTDVYICLDEASSASLAPRFHQGVAKSQGGRDESKEDPQISCLPFLTAALHRPFQGWSGCCRRGDPTEDGIWAMTHRRYGAPATAGPGSCQAASLVTEAS